MPRRPRVDLPGRLHHVMNRGLARRTVFESQADMRMFLALLARVVRAGRVEVHAFALLSTHFHLLLRSLDGNISETLRLVLNGYVRWFNRTRRRDGPLFRGRFRSFPVESPGYFQTLVRYIDDNPVQARLAAGATQYPYGSAQHHVRDSARPRWLCRDLVHRSLSSLVLRGVPLAEAYERAFPSRVPPAARRFVEHRLHHPDRSPAALQGLAVAASEHVFAWMTRKARLADGTKPTLPLVLPDSVEHLVDVHRERAPRATIDAGGHRPLGLWDIALVGLLRGLAGESLEAIARRLRVSRDEARRLHATHRDALETDVGYRGIVVELARRLVRGGGATDFPLESLASDGEAPLGLR